MNNASLIILAVEIIHTEYFSGFPGQDTNILKLCSRIPDFRRIRQSI